MLELDCHSFQYLTSRCDVGKSLCFLISLSMKHLDFVLCNSLGVAGRCCAVAAMGLVVDSYVGVWEKGEGIQDDCTGEGTGGFIKGLGVYGSGKGMGRGG
ncbi:hypothetical protein Tco_1490569 [Tanacetum coccineum]